MTMPSGLLEWGQAGVYDAIDDRNVVTALANGRTGLVKPARLSAGPGLQVILHGGWLAVADAGDGSAVICGDRQDNAVTVPAGGAAQRLDHLWCDVEPDEARWTLALISASQMVGRAGILLGSIRVPAGANSSSQFTLIPALSTYGASDLRSGMVRTELSLVGTGTQLTGPQNEPHTIASLRAGTPGERESYIFRAMMYGNIGDRGTWLAMGIRYPSGLGYHSMSLIEVWGQPRVHSTVPAFHNERGDTGTGPGNQYMVPVIGVIPAGVEYQYSMDGRIDLEPLVADQPWSLDFVANADNGAPFTVWAGSYMTLQRIRWPD